VLTRRNVFDSVFDDIVAMQRDMLRFFDRAIGAGAPAEAAAIPAAEAYYKDGQHVLTLALPGVEPGSVDVTAQGSTLTVRGERPALEVPADDVILNEIPAGKFERVFVLPEGLETDRIAATWNHGMLTIRIPVAAKLLPKKVPVEVAKA
jgi:HSP20 family protein